MRVVYSGGILCSPQTLKRLILIADEVGFIDRPSISFGNWGTVGMQTPVRAMVPQKNSVSFTAHEPPSGPATTLYLNYIRADLNNPAFVSIFLQGLKTDPDFQIRFIQTDGLYGSDGISGRQILDAFEADPSLAATASDEPFKTDSLFKIDTPEGRKITLKTFLIDASIHITNTLVIAEKTGLLPVSDNLFFSRLLGLRFSTTPYLGQTPLLTPSLGLTIAKAAIPDEALEKLEFDDLFRYRAETKDAYRAWAAEIERMASAVEGSDPQNAEKELLRILKTDVQPKLLEYSNEMASTRDKLFGDLIKNISKWELPTISAVHLAGIDLSSTLALFASLAPAIPPLVDFYNERRDVKRKNFMSYLIGITPK